MALLVYSRGGDTNVPWAIVSFLREISDRLTVLVPFAAHSSGTLLALGADEIHMSRFATLSPIDPTVTNAFNPTDPTNPGLRIPIAVEDVLAYIELADEQMHDHDGTDAAFHRLAESVHPLALGNVKRSINQIRQLATKLISLHPPGHSEDELSALVTRLTTEFYSHMHLISRSEALEIGLPIADRDQALENLLDSYYEQLKMDLVLTEPFNPAAMLKVAAAAAAPPAAPMPGVGETPNAPILPVVAATAGAPVPPLTLAVSAERAYIETATTCDAFISRGEVGQQVINFACRSATGRGVRRAFRTLGATRGRSHAPRTAPNGRSASLGSTSSQARRTLDGMARPCGCPPECWCQRRSLRVFRTLVACSGHRRVHPDIKRGRAKARASN